MDQETEAKGIKSDSIREESIGKGLKKSQKAAIAVESGEDSFDDERDSDDDDNEPGYVNQITPDEIERYRNLLELAV